jgi:hypothetical protein
MLLYCLTLQILFAAADTIDIRKEGAYNLVQVEGKRYRCPWCLTKHHAVQMYGGRGEGRSGCIAPHILNLDIRWRWVVSFRLRSLYPRGKNPGIHWIGGWVCFRADLDVVEKRKILPCRESNRILNSTPKIRLLALSYAGKGVWSLSM